MKNAAVLTGRDLNERGGSNPHSNKISFMFEKLAILPTVLCIHNDLLSMHTSVKYGQGHHALIL